MSKANERPFDQGYFVNSRWMPSPASTSLKTFLGKVAAKPKTPLNEHIEALRVFVESDPALKWLMDDALKANQTILKAPATPNNAYQDGIHIPDIPDFDTLLHMFNGIMDEPPQFADGDLVGLPFSAVTVGIDPTQSGATLFRMPAFNQHLAAILNEWHKFLRTESSNTGFRVEGEDWLSPKAKAQYKFPLWKKDFPEPPYWSSWNSFFTRLYENPEESRPIDGPDTNRVVVSASDSSLYRWDRLTSESDTYWFKDMPYSLTDILSSPVPEQQAIIDDHDLVNMFKGGYIFQTYLNPYDFHRWWSPANGRIMFKPFTIPGAYFLKLVLPDYGGATTASLPYLAQVNARGLVVIETEDFGNVCCIPLGMSEVSTVAFDDGIDKHTEVKKGRELGAFNYGGSSFAMLFQDLPDHELVFKYSESHDHPALALPQQPVGASSSAGSGEYPTNIGSQIGVWQPK